MVVNVLAGSSRSKANPRTRLSAEAVAEDVGAVEKQVRCSDPKKRHGWTLAMLLLWSETYF